MKKETRKAKILIVDDTVSTASMVRVALENAGYDIFVATNGKKAIELAGLVKPDLVLLDILMAGVDGYETCYLLKSKKELKTIPVIFMSSLTETFDKVKSFKVGAVDYITKPIENEELLSRVNTHITISQLQNKLIELNTNLEEKILERTDELKNSNAQLQQEIEERKAALKQKDLLLKELYHRTKNNMEIICGLLTLQSSFTKDNILEAILRKFNDRIRSMALVHEKLYQSEDLSNISLQSYLFDLINYLKTSYNNERNDISLILNIMDTPVSIETAIPCGIIVNELITNSLKHAFDNKKHGKIEVNVNFTAEDEIVLLISDNGVGLSEDFNFENTSSLGMFLVKNLVKKQLHGTINLNRDCGTEFLIKFKKLKYKKRI